MSSVKKNCINCRFGAWESHGDYCEFDYFVCSKRFDDGYNNLDENLCKPSYREKAKVCCEPKYPVKCKDCGVEELFNYAPTDDYRCFSCWHERKVNSSNKQA